MSDNTAARAVDVSLRPLVIVGMHRSGTSLAASLLAGAGIDLGAKMLGAGTGNLRGHYEDLDFLELHKRILVANGLDEDGYSCPDHLAVPAGLAAEATRLVAARRAAGRPWGWKEPRTTLLLDFYGGLLPDARYLCVFRRPWEVVDSLLRRGYSGDRVFEADPVIAARVYHHYNRLMLELVDSIPERCLVVEATQVAAEPEGVVRRVGGLLAMPLGTPPPVFDGELMHTDDSAGRAAVVAAVCPGAMDVYRQLRSRAGSESPVPHLADHAAPELLGGEALREWARYAGSARAARTAAAEIRETRAALATAHEACSEAHGSLRDAIEHREAVTRHAAAQAADLETLRAHAAMQAADLETLRSHTAMQAADLETLRAHTARQAADLETLRSHAATQATDLETLRSHAATQAADLETLRSHAATQAADLETLRSHAATQAADLETLRSHAATQAADLETLATADAWHRQEEIRLGREVVDLKRQLEDQWSRRLVRLLRRITVTARASGSRDATAGAGGGPV